RPLCSAGRKIPNTGHFSVTSGSRSGPPNIRGQREPDLRQRRVEPEPLALIAKALEFGPQRRITPALADGRERSTARNEEIRQRQRLRARELLQCSGVAFDLAVVAQVESKLHSRGIESQLIVADAPGSDDRLGLGQSMPAPVRVPDGK